MAKDKPWGDERSFSDIKGEKREIVKEWVSYWLIPGNRVWKKADTYSLKHRLQYDTTVYLTNNQFKEALILCGLTPNSPEGEDWYFKIDKQSPICARYRSYKVPFPSDYQFANERVKRWLESRDRKPHIHQWNGERKFYSCETNSVIEVIAE